MASIGRVAAWAGAAFLYTLVAADVAAAATAAQCRKLEASLAAASKPAATQTRSYDKAILQQQQQIAKVRAQRDDLGCGFLSFRAECSGVKSTLARMERNLFELEQTRGSMGSRGNKSEQARILAALRDTGCRGGDRTASIGDQRKPTLFERIFGAQEETTQIPGGVLERPGSGGGTAWAGGNFRTLCVRTCDGYFFPISYSSSRGNFDRDSKACAAMCPGTDVALYYHRVPSEESDQMISVATRQPYADLPTAFDYKEADFVRPEGCACGAAKAYSIIAGDSADPDTESDRAAVPTPRPDSAEDPETAANRTAGLDVATLKVLMTPPQPEAEMPVASIAETAPRAIRVVGPAFLPDPEAAIDLRAPAQREIR